MLELQLNGNNELLLILTVNNTDLCLDIADIALRSVLF